MDALKERITERLFIFFIPLGMENYKSLFGPSKGKKQGE